MKPQSYALGVTIVIAGVLASCSNPGGSCIKTAPVSGQVTIQPLKAGVAEGFLDAPVGTSMGGFGGRQGVKSPFAANLGGSVGFYTRLRVKALALDNGGERIIIVKTPLIFPTDWLVRRVADKVKADSGYDVLDHMIMGGTHSHSGPGRIWRLPPNLGTMGLDEYGEETFRRIVNSIAAVIIRAINNIAPAKIGYGTMENFDPQDHVNGDRRCENNFLYPQWDDPTTGSLKDSRLVLIRVDKADGTPLAAVINFGMHGTEFSDFQFTEDAPGAVEAKVEEAFGKSGQKMTALFIQGTGGDVSPQGGFNGAGGTQALEALGEEAAVKVTALYYSITTETNVPMEIVSRRYALNRDVIGYSSDEFTDESGNPYEFGAFNCGHGVIGMPDIGSCQNPKTSPDGVDCCNPQTHLVNGKLGCFSMDQIQQMFVQRDAWEHPPLVFSQTRLTAARIGNLVIATLPGEPLSSLGLFLREKIQQEVNFKSAVTVAVFGYCQDHHLYLSDNGGDVYNGTNGDWWQGAYETGMSIWGPKFGEWLNAKSTELVRELVTPQKEDNSGCDPAPIVFDSTTQPKIPVAPDVVPAQSVPAPAMFTGPTTKARFVTETIYWHGGDPAVDMPVATLQYSSGSTWLDYVDNDGKVLDSTLYKMATHYEANPSYAAISTTTQRDHVWTVDWETTKDFTGTTLSGFQLRFHITGKYYDGTSIQPYDITSTTFTIIPSSAITLNGFQAFTATGTIKLKAYYPANPVSVACIPDYYGRCGVEIRQAGGYRLRDINFPPYNPVPITGTSIVTITDTTSSTFTSLTLTYNPSAGTFVGSWAGGFSSGDILQIGVMGFSDPWANTNGTFTTTTAQ